MDIQAIAKVSDVDLSKQGCGMGGTGYCVRCHKEIGYGHQYCKACGGTGVRPLEGK